MAQEKQIWSPKCSKFISASHFQDIDCDIDETHLEFQAEDGSKFILNLSSSEVNKLWDVISMLLQDENFPSGTKSSKQH